MHSNKDTELARLTDIVASLAQQMAALAPFVAANVGTNGPVPGAGGYFSPDHPRSIRQSTAPVAPAVLDAPAAPAAPASLAPVAPAAPEAPASLAPVASAAPVASPSSISSSQQTLVNEETQDEQGSGSHRRWYVVIVGLQVGVFRGWTNTAPLVLGVTGSIFNREPTREAAITAFNMAAASGQAKRAHSLATYYKRNQDTLREKARLRMAKLRAANASKSAGDREKSMVHARASRAKYRERNRVMLRIKEAKRRAQRAKDDVSDAASDGADTDVPSDGGYAGDDDEDVDPPEHNTEDQKERAEKVSLSATLYRGIPKFLLTNDFRRHLQRAEAAYN
ncbi:hypothetical protein EYR40_004957 [Pleurotus pulmonarius]|nr:hypothetical protein EYR38_006012 [Pleurotus pulmonarius]KAF4601758.1 hypothetical protein EYR40_004957 [Pleurotus pulmonarius]